MDSYVNIKNKIANLQSQKNTIKIERVNILAPIYDILSRYKGTLPYIFPKNPIDADPKRLVSRCSVLVEDIENSAIEDSLKERMINLVEKAKEDIIKINEQEERIDEEIKIAEISLNDRKQYVLSRIDEINQKDEEIEEIDKVIKERTALLENEDLEPSIKVSIREVIDDYNDKKRKLKRTQRILQDEQNLLDDVKLLAQEREQEEQKKNKEEAEAKRQALKQQLSEELNLRLNKSNDYKESYLVDEKNQTRIMALNNADMYKKIDELENVSEDLIGKWVVKQEDGAYLEVDKSKEKEGAILVLPNSAIINKKQGTYIIPKNNELIDNIDEELYEEEGIEIVSSSRNWLLEQKIKLKKNLRVVLGVAALASLTTAYAVGGGFLTQAVPLAIMATNLIEGIRKDPDRTIPKDSVKLIKYSKRLLRNKEISKENKQQISDLILQLHENYKKYLKMDKNARDYQEQLYIMAELNSKIENKIEELSKDKDEMMEQEEIIQYEQEHEEVNQKNSQQVEQENSKVNNKEQITNSTIQRKNVELLVNAAKKTDEVFKERGDGSDMVYVGKYLKTGNCSCFTATDGVRETMVDLDYDEVAKDVKATLIENAIASLGTPNRMWEFNPNTALIISWGKNEVLGNNADYSLEDVFSYMMEQKEFSNVIINNLNGVQQRYKSVVEKSNAGNFGEEVENIIAVLEKEKAKILEETKSKSK